MVGLGKRLGAVHRAEGLALGRPRTSGVALGGLQLGGDGAHGPVSVAVRDRRVVGAGTHAGDALVDGGRQVHTDGVAWRKGQREHRFAVGLGADLQRLLVALRAELGGFALTLGNALAPTPWPLRSDCTFYSSAELWLALPGTMTNTGRYDGTLTNLPTLPAGLRLWCQAGSIDLQNVAMTFSDAVSLVAPPLGQLPAQARPVDHRHASGRAGRIEGEAHGSHGLSQEQGAHDAAGYITSSAAGAGTRSAGPRCEA